MNRLNVLASLAILIAVLVCMRDYLIVDVDARNGGVESFKQLVKDVPSILQCCFVVNTGSGGGSQHYYLS